MYKILFCLALFVDGTVYQEKMKLYFVRMVFEMKQRENCS